jgi:transcriptional regulator with XRE-family HTH domain
MKKIATLEKQFLAEMNRQGITYAALARCTGFSSSSIRGWLTGKRDISAVKVIKMAHVLGCRLVVIDTKTGKTEIEL